jgi:hypothetical protein
MLQTSLHTVTTQLMCARQARVDVDYSIGRDRGASRSEEHGAPHATSLIRP